MYHFQKRQENVLFDQNNPVTIGRHTLTIVYKKYIMNVANAFIRCAIPEVVHLRFVV